MPLARNTETVFSIVLLACSVDLLHPPPPPPPPAATPPLLFAAAPAAVPAAVVVIVAPFAAPPPPVPAPPPPVAAAPFSRLAVGVGERPFAAPALPDKQSASTCHYAACECEGESDRAR